MADLPDIVVSVEDRDRVTRAIAAAVAAGRWEAAIFLANEIHRARLVPAALFPPDRMGLNAHGRYLDEQSGLAHFGILVLPGYERRSFNMISVLSELGAALLGLQVGQRMHWRSPRFGPRAVRLLEILEPSGQAEPDRPCGE